MHPKQRQVKGITHTNAGADVTLLPFNLKRVGLIVFCDNAAAIALGLGEPAVMAKGIWIMPSTTHLHLKREEIGDSICADIHVLTSAPAAIGMLEILES